jgi:chaperone modulatory protein CbpM
MTMRSNNILTEYTVVAISSENPIALSDLAHACGADRDWVVRLVEVGIIEPPVSRSSTRDLAFFSVPT